MRDAASSGGGLRVEGLVRLAAICAMAVVLIGCTRDGRPSVLLVTIDTLRADRLGCYGCEGAETPNLDRLASEGVLFEQVGAHVPVTLPSHATILTGLLPASHGVHDNSTFSLSDTVTTVAEVFRGAGYRTGAVMGAYVLARQFGLDQGFVTYQDTFPEPAEARNTAHFLERSAEDVSQIAMDWLSACRGRPFFLWLHYFDPHFPYEPPPQEGLLAESTYEGEIAYTDREVGRVLEYLERRDLTSSTLVVVTSDHGEGLGEHAEETHSHFVYETAMRVPLIMRWPERLPRGIRVSPLARTQDIALTLLDLAGLPAPEQVGGMSLVPAIDGAGSHDTLSLGESMLPLYHFGMSPLVSVRTLRWKYIAAPGPELYDLVTDPHETRNVLEEHPEVAERLLGIVERYRKDVVGGSSTPCAVPEEQEQKLAVLGYVSAEPRPLPEGAAWSALADPKDHAELISLARRAARLLGVGRPADALPLLEGALPRTPLPLLRRLQAAALLQAGRLDEAADALHTGLAADSSYSAFAVLLGRVELLRGNPAKALEALELALRLFPFDPVSLYLKGQALLLLGRVEDAETAYALAVQLQPTQWRARIALARTQLSLGRAESALREALAVLDRTSDPAGAHELVGRCYEAMGEWGEAASAYSRADALDTARAEVLARMALCYHRAGKQDKALAVWEQYLSRFGEDARVLSMVAGGRLARGDTAGSVRAWERQIALEPGSGSAWAALIAVAAARGDTAAAGSLAVRAAEACPGDSTLARVARAAVNASRRRGG